MTRTGPLLLCLLALFPAAAGFADESQDRGKLETVSANIRKLETALKTVTGQRDKIAEELQVIETASANTRKEIARTQSQIRQLESDLKQLTEQRQKLQATSRKQQRLMYSQINAAYRLGQEEPVKLLLNQENPSAFSRTIKYYSYFLEARATKLQNYINTLHSIATTEQAIGEKTRSAESKRSQLVEESNRLSSRMDQRNKVMLQLDQQINSQQLRLGNLQREREHLKKVLSAIEYAINDIHMPSGSGPFYKQKGTMHWPLKGSLQHRFGSRRNAEMKWEGWLLTAPEGSDITSIYHGRVVFSDYLRGHGLLMIVDHGDGYMSLYAHNQMLLKEAGDWVTAGEVIAKVGNTGGRKDHALYFEIRKNGKPANPQQWLAKG